MISCKGCGANMRFDIKKQALVCDYCDSVEKIAYKNKADITSEKQELEMLVHTCPQCGAELYTQEETAATFCSYCGSSVLLESKLVSVNSPDYIIPFKITKEEAEEAYKKKLRTSIFAPSNMKNAEIQQMRGIYMPYWEYYMKDKTATSFTVYKNEQTKGGYLYRDKYNAKYNIFIESDGLEFDASSQLPDDLSQSYAPFDFKESKVFNPAYMSGFYADLGDIEGGAYTDAAVQVLCDVVADEVHDHINAHALGCGKEEIKKRIKIDSITPGLGMYPVWFACARSKDGKNINYAAVNGQTGKVAADMPIDKKKLILWTLIFALPFFALFYFLLTPNTHTTVWFVAILAIVGTIIGFSRVNQLKKEDGGLKAAGKAQRVFSLDKKIKNGFIARIAIIIILSFGVVLLDPVYDYYFYAVALVNAVLCGWTFWRIFDIYNKYIARPLPQLNKRGGEGA